MLEVDVAQRWLWLSAPQGVALHGQSETAPRAIQGPESCFLSLVASRRPEFRATSLRRRFLEASRAG